MVAAAVAGASPTEALMYNESFAPVSVSMG